MPLKSLTGRRTREMCSLMIHMLHFFSNPGPEKNTVALFLPDVKLFLFSPEPGLRSPRSQYWDFWLGKELLYMMIPKLLSIFRPSTGDSDSRLA